jgi:hypothetical protein
MRYKDFDSREKSMIELGVVVRKQAKLGKKNGVLGFREGQRHALKKKGHIEGLCFPFKAILFEVTNPLKG